MMKYFNDINQQTSYTMKTYSKETIVETLSNPKEFKRFIAFFNDFSHFTGEYLEDGTFYRPIAEDINEAFYLYKNQKEALIKIKRHQREFNNLLISLRLMGNSSRFYFS